jgi:hypothetical protein
MFFAIERIAFSAYPVSSRAIFHCLFSAGAAALLFKPFAVVWVAAGASAVAPVRPLRLRQP